jgi:hypothetical protein
MMKPICSAQALFLGEQDGEAERTLKRQLVACFVDDAHVTAAYLVRLSYEDTPGLQVALCIKSKESHQTDDLPCVRDPFHKLFKTTQHMDIMFLSETSLVAIQ